MTDGQTYSMNYQYDLAGNITSQTYPTGRVVTQTVDNEGRIANISGHASGGSPKTYANSFGYSPHGAIERMRLGNGRWEHTSFNNRLQPTEIGLGNSATDSSVLKLGYEYGTTSNNGNILKQVITVPTIGTATGFIATQHYQYDQLNRLTGAQEVNGTSSDWQSSGTLWQQKFSYDRYGNRAVDTANTTSTMIGPNPVVSTSTNRITPRSGEYYFYDNAGNTTKDQSNDTFDCDAENKLVRYKGGATQSGGADYSYDGDGRRVKKATPSETLVFVYDVSGQIVAEYTTSTTESNGTSYLTSDTLGSPRVITKTDGSVRARHDYLPFGEELFATTGSRATTQGYDTATNPADKTRQKFTGSVRDYESGLDYAINRYYANWQGRFTSVDPLHESGEPEQPQSWNRYSYTINNPLRFVDPDGLRYVQRQMEDGNTQYMWCATDECYNNATDSTSENYAGWTAVTFDESQPFEYPCICGAGGDKYGTYRLNPDGTHGYKDVLEGNYHAISTDWGAQLAIGGLLNGLRSLFSGLFTRTVTTEAATQATEQATTHGAQRLAGRVFSEADIVLTKTGQQFLQKDGATVFIKEVAPGKFNILATGTRGVITALKNVSEKKVAKIAANHGWYSPLK